MNTAMLIQHLFGPYLDRTKSYPSPLPPDVQQWYCYTVDSGHSIAAAPAALYDPGREPEHFLVPVPVKTVLRGYEQKDGYIIINVTCSSESGLSIPPDDEEL